MTKFAPILLAEDDDNDVFFVRRALQQAGLANPLIVARDGKEAVDYLEGAGPYNDRARHPLPGLLLLDLKMPLLNGFDVLTWLQTRPELGYLPVVVLSSSDHDLDMQKARQLGADDYRVKPSDFQNLVQIVQELHSRWLTAESQAA